MAYMGYGGSPEYVEAIGRVVVALMIEKQGAVVDLDPILELPGVGLIQFGRVDYSLSIGRVGEAGGDEVRAVERMVIERCVAAGVPVRVEIASPPEVEHYRELGVRHFSLGVDLAVLHEWWRDNGAAVRERVNAA
jgi:2-keto-3-deoxy-L-rhamnonate aldolase RhmA